MIAPDFVLALLPEHLLLAGIVALLMVDAMVKRSIDGFAITLAVIVLATIGATGLAIVHYEGAPFPGQFSVTPADLIAKAIVLVLAIPVVLMSRGDFSNARFHVLLLSSLYGTCLMLSADSLLTLFLGLELMSLPVYVLVILADRPARSAEAALKYLVLGGTASAMFLMGSSLLFGATGSFASGAFAAALLAHDTLGMSAVVLITVAFLLKAAVVPFHAWAPDAYEGASVPVTAYMATIVKGGIVLAAIRLFGESPVGIPLAGLIALLPLVSIVWGNLAAMKQPSFRRMIAYSSIAHAGYLFYAFLGDGAGRFQAVAFYVLAYGLMNLLAFAALPVRDDDAASDRLDNLRGLFARAPFAAIMIAVAMLSLAGIPPLPGFVAKFLIFRNVMAAGYTAYAVLGLVGSYLGIYFYLRVIQLMFMSPVEASVSGGAARRLALGTSLLCLLPTIALMFFPGWFMGLF